MGKKKGGGGSCHQQPSIKNHPEHEEENALHEEEAKGCVNNNNNNNNKKTGSGDRGRSAVVLRVPIHCDGCSDDVRRSLKGFPGMEKVTVDMASNKLTVVGEVDPIRIREQVERKTGKKVDIISPANPKKKPDPKRHQDKKPKEPPFSTVVLRIALHCDGCICRIYKTIRRFEGVASVSMDMDNEVVIVKGMMEVKKLIELLKEKMKRPVQIVPPRKEGGKEKDIKCGKEEEEEGREVRAGNCCLPQDHHSYDGSHYYCCANYTIQMVHAPQLFSDENPNACSVM